MMTPKDFDKLLDRYGGEPNNWPPTLCPAARELLARSVQARAEWRAMQTVEAGLTDTLMLPRNRPINFDMPARPAARDRSRLAWRVRAGWSGAAVAMLAFGFVSGQAAALAAAGTSPILYGAVAMETYNGQ